MIDEVTETEAGTSPNCTYVHQVDSLNVVKLVKSWQAAHFANSGDGNLRADARWATMDMLLRQDVTSRVFSATTSLSQSLLNPSQVPDPALPEARPQQG
jgi:hypothetical protein